MGISQRRKGAKFEFLGELRALVRERKKYAIGPGQHCIRNQRETNQSAQATGTRATVGPKHLCLS